LVSITTKGKPTSTNLNGNLATEATIDRKNLKELLKSLGDTEIKIETSTEHLSIQCKDLELKIENCNDLDAIRQNEKHLKNNSDYLLKLEKKTFLHCFKPLLSHCPKMDVRYYLNGVLFDCDQKGDINLVATDGHRLLLNKIGGGEGSSRRIVSRRLIDIAVKSTTNYKDDVLIIVGDIESSISIGETFFHMKNIHGTYPDYMRVIPNRETKLVFNRESLLQALEKVKPFVHKRYKLAKFAFAKNLHIKASEISVAVDFEGNCKEMEIGFNVDYIIDALKVSNKPTVNFSVEDIRSSVKITQGDLATCVVMPARLN